MEVAGSQQEVIEKPESEVSTSSEAGNSEKIAEIESMLMSLKQENESLKKKNGDLIGENKKYRTRAQNAETERERVAREELEEKGKFKELLEKEKVDKKEIEIKLKEFQKKSVLNAINYEVSKYAPDAEDVDLVINALKIAEDEIDWDTGRVSGISNKVDELRKTKKFLFKTAVPGMNNKVPMGGETKPKDFNELSTSEQDAELTGLLEQKLGL